VGKAAYFRQNVERYGFMSSKKLRVAVFNTQPPHLYRGGVERRIIEVSRRLRDNIATFAYSGTKAGFKKLTVVNGVVMVPCFSTNKNFLVDNWFFNNSIARNFNMIKADVYEAHTVSGYGFLRALKKHRKNKPFIETIHGVLADEYLKSFRIGFSTPRVRLSRFFLRYLSKIEMESAREATLLVTVSQYSRKKIVQLYGVEAEKIRVVPNGVDVQLFKPLEVPEHIKRKTGINGGQCVLFVGNLVPRKGLYLLIEAARYIINENRNVKFVIAGDGPLKGGLIRYARSINVAGNFVFLGDVSDADLPKIYNCSDIVVLPSLQEGQGITLLEAQAVAKPVVACNVGGVSEIVLNRETGLLVDPDARKFAEAILKLLSDKSLRERMGINGRRFVCENFTWDLCAKRMLQVYREAIELTI